MGLIWSDMCAGSSRPWLYTANTPTLATKRTTAAAASAPKMIRGIRTRAERRRRLGPWRRLPVACRRARLGFIRSGTLPEEAFERVTEGVIETTDLLAELAWRRLVKEQSDGLAERLARGPISGYIGFDASAT